MDLDSITKKFLLGEQKENPSLLSYIQVLQEILNSLHPATVKEKNKIDVAKQHLNEIRKQGRQLVEQVRILEEQVRVLEETKSKRK